MLSNSRDHRHQWSVYHLGYSAAGSLQEVHLVFTRWLKRRNVGIDDGGRGEGGWANPERDSDVVRDNAWV
jgi:hypothetical protein